ncbi:MAG: CDC27 family protein [Clostridiales bacterium]|nr:CDC27 family protein [Clostridiales bacterium]
MVKKILCERCGQRRGRRQCPKYDYINICGECCSKIQLDSDCPDECINKGKVSARELHDKINSLMDAGITYEDKNPKEAIRLFNKVLGLDKNFLESYLEMSSAYDSLGMYDNSVRCLEKAYKLNKDGNLLYMIAEQYIKSGEYQKPINIILSNKEKFKDCRADYLLGKCYFSLKEYKNSISCMKKVLDEEGLNKGYRNKAAIILSRSYLSIKDAEDAIKYAKTLDDEYSKDRRELIEEGYFSAKRIYELLKYIESFKGIGYFEKDMLLRCAPMLKIKDKNVILNIIDDLLRSTYLKDDERLEIICRKICILFEDSRMNESFNLFEQNKESIIKMSGTTPECYSACCFAAFFAYSLDRPCAMHIYNSIAPQKTDEIVIDELYNAFKDMDISPSIKAKSIAKSVKVLSGKKNGSFLRTRVAADLLFENGEYYEALDMYHRASDAKAEDAFLLYRMAVCNIKLDKFKSAFKLLDRILSLNKYIPSAYPKIIICCVESGLDWADYFKHMEIEKLNFNEVYELGECLSKNEYYDKAGFLFNYLIDNYKNVDIYRRKKILHNLSFIYRKLKNYEKGIELIKSVPNEYLSRDLSIDLWCLYYESMQYDKAAEVFDIYLKDIKDPEVYFNSGILALKLKKYKEAVDYFEGCIHISIEQGYRKDELIQRALTDISICKANMGRGIDALSYVDRALKVRYDDRALDVLFMIQKKLLHGKEKNQEICGYESDCISKSECFDDEINSLFEKITSSIYPRKESIVKKDRVQEKIESFVKIEREKYKSDKDYIERSESAYCRLINEMFALFDKRVLSEITAADIDRSINEYDDFGRNGSQEYLYGCITPYFEDLSHLCHKVLYPYYKKSIDFLPVVHSMEDFKKLGIYCYESGGKRYYRIDFSFDISCSKYLFEINCHPGIRSEYIDCRIHYMPWEKLVWIISGIEKKWDIIDGIKSAGLLLLFYGGYKNYLGIEGDFKGSDEIIKLSGDIIKAGNECDYAVKNMLNGTLEYNMIENIRKLRGVIKGCIADISKVKLI